MNAAQTKFARDTAEEAYKNLLAGPIPASLLDYRRAILQAALIGQVLASTSPDTSWQSSPPQTPGAWEIASRETDYEPSPVTVVERDGELWAVDPHVGCNPLQTYHYNLTDIFWRKAAS